MPIPEYASTAEFHVAEDGTAGVGGAFVRFGTLKDVTISSSTNDKLEETFDETGKIRGKGRTEITFESVIPKAGKRIDFVELGMVKHASIKVVVVVAGKRRTYLGIIDSDTEKFGINSNASDSIKLMCGEPQMGAI